MASSNVDVVLRRSKRKRRRGSEWRETLKMTIRASRAKGDSDKISVASLGGRPSHVAREQASSDESEEEPKRMAFCGNCGHKHAPESRFCTNCGSKRESIPVVSKQQRKSSPDSAETTSNDADVKNLSTAVVLDKATRGKPSDDVVNDSATASASVVHDKAKRGRPSNCNKLRCGWSVEGNTFIAPDGVKFQSRKEASTYWNKDIPKLEPARQDNWQVFVDASNTHITWIAPDGQKLNSFISAKSYAKSSSLPIYGKDGITKSIASFFGKSQTTGKKKSSDTIIDLPHNKPCVRCVNNKSSAQDTHAKATHHQDVETSPQKSKKIVQRKFVVPKQSSQAAIMQKLMKKAATLRIQRKHTKADQIAEQYTTEYTVKRQISDSMATKACPCLCLP